MAAQSITIAVVLGLIVVLSRGLTTPAAGVMGAAIALFLSGVIDAQQAFAGFSSGAVVTVAALFVVSGAIERTGLLTRAVERVIRPGRQGLAPLLTPVALCSGIMNNTPIVAAMAPAVSRAAHAAGSSPSRYLMPLSYATILGGVVTTIGTSTNLVVSGLLVERGLPPFGLLEMSPVGLPVAAVGIVMLVLTAGRLLPERIPPDRQVLADPRDYALELRVTPGGPLDGRRLVESPLRDLSGGYLAARRADGAAEALGAEDVLHGGDVLAFVGDLGAVSAALASAQLAGASLTSSEPGDQPDVGSWRLAEAVVGSGSSLVGRSLKDVAFRSRHGAVVLAVHRDGEPLRSKLGALVLRPGDALLLLRDTASVESLAASSDFGVVSGIGTRDDTPNAPVLQVWITVAVTAVMVTVATVGLLEILRAALAAILVLLLTRCITVQEARRAVDLDVLVVIAGSFALGAAVESSGLAGQIAGIAAAAASHGGAALVVALLVVLTMMLTEPLSNAAAASLMVPVALDIADRVGADPRVLAVGVAVAASASFLTPIGYQTNTMVWGLGGYHFGDYARLGAPLTLVTAVIVVVVVTMTAF